MTDPADRFLEERLHALARDAAVPVVPPGDDVRRGRRRLLRMRLAMGGATAGTLAVVLGITSLTAGDPKATEPPAITQPTGTPSSTPDSSPTAAPGSQRDHGSAGKPGKGGGDGDLAGAPKTDPSGSGIDDSGATTELTDPPTGAASGTADGGTTTHQGTTGHDHQFGGGPTADTSGTPTVSATPSSEPTATGTPTTTPTSSPTSSPTEAPTSTPTSTPTVPPGTTKVRVPQVLRSFNKVLAEHLDPERVHLQPYDRQVDSKQTRTSHGHLYALGSTYRWEDGRSLSGLGLTVASGWDQVVWSCGATYADWDCHAGSVDGAEVARHDGVVQVAVEHGDGQVVLLTADPTYDAGRLAASGIDSDEADLVSAAADPRLTLPGTPPVAPPRITLESFSAAGVSALVQPGETFQQTGADRSPWVRGEWTGTDGRRSTLSWTTEPIYSAGRFTCLTTYRSCTTVTVDDLGTTVHLAMLKQKAGGGWLVQYDGDAYGVRVYSSNRAFPKKRAYAFVTQTGWQPAR